MNPEWTAEQIYRYYERLAILCQGEPPTPEAEEIARKEADEYGREAT